MTVPTLGWLDMTEEEFREALAEMGLGGLLEAYVERLHPRNRIGRWREKPGGVLTRIGATPFRGAGRAQGEDYFETTRYKGFENALPQMAAEAGLEFVSSTRTWGVWVGGGEPSAAVLVRDGDEAVQSFMDAVGARYDQDAVIRFKVGDGPSVHYLSQESVDAERVEQALAEVDLPGGTVRADGRLELIDLDDSALDQVELLAENLELTWKVERGHGELRFAGEHYEKAGQRREAAEESALRGDEAGRPGRDAEGHDAGDPGPEGITSPASLEVDEAFDPNQPRYPRGWTGPPGKGGQWRPKIAHGRGRIGPRGMANDIFYLKENIKWAQTLANPGPERLKEIGAEFHKLAMRYSTKRAYEQRLETVRQKHWELTDQYADEWQRVMDLWPEDEPHPRLDDFLTPERRKQLRALADEEVKLRKEMDRADRDAMLGLLSELRPMGGTLKLNEGEPIQVTNEVNASGATISNIYAEKGTFYRGMQEDFDRSMREVQRLIPSAWIEESNEKGSIQFAFTSDRGSHGFQGSRSTEEQFEEMETGVDRLIAQGYSWVGYSDPWPILGAPDGSRVWVSWGGDPNSAEKETTGPPAGRNRPVEHVVEGPRKVARGGGGDRRASAIQRALSGEHEWVGMLGGENGVPILNRGSTWPGGPPIYDWVDVRGSVANADPEVSELGLPGFDPSKIDTSIGPPPETPAQQANSRIRTHPAETDIIMHELGHRFEALLTPETNSGYRRLNLQLLSFLTRRTEGEPLQKLQDVQPEAGYKPDEVSRPDDFFSPYVGKSYAGGTELGTGYQPTEVLTMGLQYLWWPIFGRNINKDPEHRALTLGILAAL